MPSVDLLDVRSRLEHLAVARPRPLVALAGVLTALIGGILGGPVAALVGGVYGALAARAVTGGSAKRRNAAARSRHLDDLCALAADLRAGLPPTAAADRHSSLTSPSLTSPGLMLPGPVPPGPESSGFGLSGLGLPGLGLAGPASLGSPGQVSVAGGGGSRIAELTAAVWRLAEQTGAPAADLVERIESDARAADRAKASAAAQAAGAQATALLLAALPLGGIALGYGIGADPLHVLLHTPLGAACATGAVLLQCAGLFWSGRLTNAAVR